MSLIFMMTFPLFLKKCNSLLIFTFGNKTPERSSPYFSVRKCDENSYEFPFYLADKRWENRFPIMFLGITK